MTRPERHQHDPHAEDPDPDHRRHRTAGAQVKPTARSYQLRYLAGRAVSFGNGAEARRRITFRGARPAAEAFAACDLIAMPSRWQPYGLLRVSATISCVCNQLIQIKAVRISPG